MLGTFVSRSAVFNLNWVLYTELLLSPLISVTNILLCDNKHHKHTGTQVTVKTAAVAAVAAGRSDLFYENNGWGTREKINK